MSTTQSTFSGGQMDPLIYIQTSKNIFWVQVLVPGLFLASPTFPLLVWCKCLVVLKVQR